MASSVAVQQPPSMMAPARRHRRSAEPASILTLRREAETLARDARQALVDAARSTTLPRALRDRVRDFDPTRMRRHTLEDFFLAWLVVGGSPSAAPGWRVRLEGSWLRLFRRVFPLVPGCLTSAVRAESIAEGEANAEVNEALLSDNPHQIDRAITALLAHRSEIDVLIVQLHARKDQIRLAAANRPQLAGVA